MSDRIDTDATRGNVEQLRGCADADLGSHDVRWCLAVMDRLLDEVDALCSREAENEAAYADLLAGCDELRMELDALRSREVPDGGWWCTAECDCPCGDESSAREVPDGHVRIDGKVYRVAWVNGHSLDYTPAKLVPVEEP